MNLAFLGMDASKGYLDCSLLDFEKQPILKPFKIYDNKAGHLQLQETLNKSLLSVDMIYAGIESTGGYENNWYNSLLTWSSKVKMIRINPIRIHHESKKSMVRNIDDTISSQIIAQHLADNYTELSESQPLSLEFASAKKVHTFTKLLKKQKTQSSNQLEKLVYSSMPGLLSLWKDHCPNYLLELLIKYPSKAQILNTSAKNLAKIKFISLEKAEKIKNDILNDSGSQDDKYIQYTISQLAETVLMLGQKIAKNSKFLHDNFKSENIELIKSIPGVGIESATNLFIEIEDISRFKDASHMCSYFGVHPVFKQSGDGSYKPKMSKKGSTSYRATIYMTAKSAIMFNPLLNKTYLKCRSKGMSFNASVGVLMNKMTRMIYGILKSREKFNSQIETENKKNEETKEEKILIIKKDLNQFKAEFEELKNSPTSKLKKNKTKKAIIKSQNSLDELNTSSILSQ